uniref:PPFIA binding protein 1a n=1 Tax=Callorhinchus milii TaxID=7868 RepID=A0A4W3J1B5_CALMI
MNGLQMCSKTLDYTNGLFDCQSPTSPYMGGIRVLHLVEDLRGLVEMMENDEKEGLRCQIPDSTAELLGEWLQSHLTNGHISVTGDLYQDRLTRLEGDKESLVLQVSVLTDQVEAQGEKIRDLECSLEEHREKLNGTEEMLQQELLSRTSLETQKLDLMAEVSNLKIKLTSMEKDRLEFEERYGDNEGLFQEINDLRMKVTEMENERMQFEKKLKSTKVRIVFKHLAILVASSARSIILIKAVEYSFANVLLFLDQEVHKMKKAVESLMAANEEKDRKIEELRQSLNRYKKVQDMVMSVAHCKKGKEGDSDESLNSGSIGVNTTEMDQAPSMTPIGALKDAALVPFPEVKHFLFKLITISNFRSSLSSCMEISKFTALPPKPPSGQQNSFDDENGTSKKARVSFGRGFFKIKGGKRAASAPNLAETEKEPTDGLLRSAEADSFQTSPSSPESKKKAKGIKKLFGKLKRSQSTNFNPDEMSDTEFKRGGTRATAGPRLGWSRDLQQTNTDLDTPFAKWTKEQVCNWLHEQGLGIYTGSSKSWITSGQTLLHASQQDLERELGIKHPLHRKKLQLALQAVGSEEEDNRGKLDYNWVTRWLDDIGLPQYKTQFDEGRVDGRMLHYMTVDDVLSLKVVSVLHHLSIKRAIQVLRINHFETNCLRRRPSDENNITPAEVSQWTNHRVMEWLRSVDLAEYAPNLRGSGVHGGLMVLEPRFNVETLAMLLNISPNKTLLRRHLATHFNLLIGHDAQQQKRESMESPDYVLLTATAKVKPKKLAFSNFGSLRKRKQDDEEYVCPMEIGLPAGAGFRQGNKQGRGIELRVYNDDDLDRIEQMDDSEGTVRQIGAFSEGINNLTHMLKEDELFKDVSGRSPCASMPDEDSNV